MVKHLSYDKRFDILFVHNGFQKGDKFFGNEMIGDLVLDVSTKKRIVGIEILNASLYLKDFGVTEMDLKELKDAELTAELHKNQANLLLTLKTKRKEIPLKITAPLEELPAIY